MFPLQEKSSSIPDDLGRDFNATSSYLKRHEAFENELVALEAQVKLSLSFLTGRPEMLQTCV